MSFKRQLYRAIRLRCPVCGEGKLFRGYFAMHETCPVCTLKFEREPGFFLGAIYFNYGITAILTSVGYGVLRFGTSLTSKQVLAITVAVATIFPIWLFRYARSWWLGFDQLHDPRNDPRSESNSDD
ncbi:MAG: DUF983 domain-containing protein [Planctomycetota bacterium]